MKAAQGAGSESMTGLPVLYTRAVEQKAIRAHSCRSPVELAVADRLRRNAQLLGLVLGTLHGSPGLRSAPGMTVVGPVVRRASGESKATANTENVLEVLDEKA